MTHTLNYYIGQANMVFPNGFISKAFQHKPPDARPVELLAQYLVSEICDLYSSESDDQANLNRIIAGLDVAASNLEDVTRCFRELRAAPPPEVAPAWS